MLFRAENNNEYDSSLRLWGGLIIFSMICVGMFIGDFYFDKGYLTPELLHSVLAMAGMWVVYQQGKKDGMAMNGNGQPPTPQPKKPLVGNPPDENRTQGRLT